MNHIIILAGGRGTRMRLSYPKVIHRINGVPLLRHLLHNIKVICPKPTIIVGYKSEEVIREIGKDYDYIHQKTPLGTGHAVMCAKKHLGQNKAIENIVVLPGDHPLIGASMVESLLASHHQNNSVLTLGTILLPHFNYDWSVFYNCGRIIRDQDGFVDKIVEWKDATSSEKAVKEVNVSYYCFRARWLWNNIEKLDCRNNANEYYLTDMVAIAKSQGYRIASMNIKDPFEGMGVNTPQELSRVEHYLYNTTAKLSMKNANS